MTLIIRKQNSGVVEIRTFTVTVRDIGTFGICCKNDQLRQYIYYILYIFINFILTANEVTIQFSFCASLTNEIIYTQQNERRVNKQRSLITVPNAFKAHSESEKHKNSVSALDKTTHRNRHPIA
jgi:hypothetical protein